MGTLSSAPSALGLLFIFPGPLVQAGVARAFGPESKELLDTTRFILDKKNISPEQVIEMNISRVIGIRQSNSATGVKMTYVLL